MSDYDRNNRFNTHFEKEMQKRRSLKSNKDEKTIKNLYQDESKQQVPKPEPRKKLTHSFVKDEPKLENELAMDNQHVARLVMIKHHHQPVDHFEAKNRYKVNVNTFDYHHPYEVHQTSKSQIPDVPAEFVSNKTVCSPARENLNQDAYEIADQTRPRERIIKIEREEERDEFADEYYGDEEKSEPPSHRRLPKSVELANLSRQSMVPIHELIAYYQYIQGDDQHQSIDRVTTVSSAATSRQSSSASQQTTQTRRSDDGGSQMQSDEFDSSYNESFTNKQTTCEPSDINDDEVLKQSQLATDQQDDGNYFGPRIVVESVDRDSDKIIPPEEHSNEEALSAIESDATLVEQNQEQQATTIVKSQDRPRLRANVILELINSERDFVKHLKDVVDGYLLRARKRPEIFTSHRINTIFANIEQLYEFQSRFLEDLEKCINWDDLAQSEVGYCFLKYEKGFSVYQHYCNNHPNATSELQELYDKPMFRAFFEECRLKQKMIDISLDGFLLTPIQKICKYPLQLNELLKNTDESHPDYPNVLNALETMRNCAILANERKRRIEALADVISFQEKVDNWFGPKLSDTSSILIHSGEVSKMTSHTWSQGVQLCLFDHLLLYSKKDLLKRNNLILKGRISMDTVTEISDADEYKPRKSFKLYCGEQQKWFVFTTKSEKEKDEWIRAFERERNLVESDENEGFHITDRELGIARRTLQHRKRSRSARFRPKRPDTAIVDQLDLDDPNMIINRTLSLPSCIHPSHVMNFVEDSRVVSTGSSTTTGTSVGARKKNSSPSSNSRSPMASSQHLADQQDQQQQSSGPTNWLRKMGSKKLSKSQVYNINGQTGHQQQQLSTKKSQNPSSSVVETVTRVASPSQNPSVPSSGHDNSSSDITDDPAAIKYEELEKRYRDHMIGEEQARLHRLNNDLPPPQNLYPRSLTPTHLQHTTKITNYSYSIDNNNSQSKGPPSHPPLHAHPQQPNHESAQRTIASNHSHSTTVASMSRPARSNDDQQVAMSGSCVSDSERNETTLDNFHSLSLSERHQIEQQPVRAARNATFETELVLSSGRVVKVREDAV